MSNAKALKTSGGPVVILQGGARGLTEIPRNTPLTRLNYFNGKFMRAEHLREEQFYLRSLVHLSSLAGGHGVVYGFDTVQSKDRAHIELGPGLAISAQGRLLYFPASASISITDLLARSVQSNGDVGSTIDSSSLNADGFGDCELTAEGGPDAQPGEGPLYVLTVGPVDAYCGHEDVFGKLCEEACVTATERPYIIEGLLVRAEPLTLALAGSSAVAFAEKHLRSRVAAAYYARESAQAGALISASGLAQDTWCLGSRLSGGATVPLAVFAVNGRSATFLDAWIARRERMETPARRYWASKMRMRPWDVFLAQILQFQCQLKDLFGGGPAAPAPADPCDKERSLLVHTNTWLDELSRAYERTLIEVPSIREAAALRTLASAPALGELKRRISEAVDSKGVPVLERVLIEGGIVELPPAGYLPVSKESLDSVNVQVRRLMGDGVDLRFCIVRPDYVAHALEQAQHMERVSLLDGLVHPEEKPKLDVLVPDGVASEVGVGVGLGFRAQVSFANDDAKLELSGVARGERTGGGGLVAYFAGRGALDELNGSETSPSFESRRVASLAYAANVARRFLLTRKPGANTLVNAKAAPRSSAEYLNRLRGAASGDAVAAAGAAWVELTVRENPLALAVGSSTTLDLRFTLAQTQEKLTLVDLFGHAMLSIDSTRQGSNGHTLIAGTLRVSGAITIEQTDGDNEDDESFGSTLALEIDVDADQRSATLRVRPQRRKDESYIEIAIGFTPGPLRISASLESFGVNEAGVPERDGEGRATALESDAALAPGKLRTVAEHAIEVVAAATGEPERAEERTQLLFAPRDGRSSELKVRAVRDWVLFHRRRERTCSAPESRPVEAPPRCYDAYHVAATANTLGRIDGLLAKLREGSNDAALELRRIVGSPFPVEFIGADAELYSDEAALLASYRERTPGRVLLRALIATQGDEDLESLERDRLAMLERVVSSVTIVDANTQRYVTDAVPSAFASTSSEGMILLVTEAAFEPPPPPPVEPSVDLRRVRLVHAAKNAAGETQFLPFDPDLTVGYDAAGVAAEADLTEVTRALKAFANRYVAWLYVVKPEDLEHQGRMVELQKVLQKRGVKFKVGEIKYDPGRARILAQHFSKPTAVTDVVVLTPEQG